MSGPAVRVTGLREVLRDLQRMGVSTDDLKEAFGTISRGVAAEASQLVAVESGDLKGTIRPGLTKNKAIVRAGSAKVPYAGVVNYKNPGDEFLTGPANNNPEQHVRHIEDELQALIRRYGLK